MPKYIPLQRNFSLFTPPSNHYETHWDALWDTETNSNKLEWDQLLERNKVVILAEAGTGKTEELKAVANRLYQEGKASFFCRIETLLDLSFEDSLDIGDVQRFTQWQNAEVDLAYFFLDSVDEAKLQKRTAFDISLRKFAAALGKHNLHRAKIFVTSRFSEWKDADFNSFITQLSIPKVFSRDQLVYKLAPLDSKQIQLFATEMSVSSPESFIEAIERADVQVFAERPQDLLDLINYWKDHDKLGSHIEMLEYNIDKKLLEVNASRIPEDTLSSDDAHQGAMSIAASATFTKKNKIQILDNTVEDETREVSINPNKVLPQWNNANLNLLLSRPIFDDVIFGAVRFHHRSTREFLTAKWLYTLLAQGGSRRNIEALLIKEKYGRKVAIPSMQAITAWLSCWDKELRDKLINIAPEVLIEFGDPSVFPIAFRLSILDALILQYQGQQHTDLHLDIAMMKRLASPEMAEAINSRLNENSSHNDLCEMFLAMIWHGEVKGSVKEAIKIAQSNDFKKRLRVTALRTILSVGTEEQKQGIIAELLCQQEIGKKILGAECSRLFPNYLSVNELMQVISAYPKKEKFRRPTIHYHLESIAKQEFEGDVLIELLDELNKLIHQEPYARREEFKLSKKYSWLVFDAVNFANHLLIRKTKTSFNSLILDTYWAYLSFIKEFPHSSFDRDSNLLQEAKNWRDFSYQLVWHVAHKTQQLSFPPDIWNGLQYYLKADLWKPLVEDWRLLEKDFRERGNKNEKMIALTMLYSIYKNSTKSESIQLLNKLQQLVKQEDSYFFNSLESWINPPTPTPEQLENQQEQKRWDKEVKKEQKEQQAIHDDWKKHLKKNAEDIKNIGNSEGFIYERSTYLYDRLREASENSSSIYSFEKWQLLTPEFGNKVAESFRDGCMDYWRQYNPKNSGNWRENNFWDAIRLALTGLAMEASYISNWTSSLSADEARLAATYCLLEMNGFPNWLPALERAFPEEVKDVFIEECRYELSTAFSGSYSKTLQSLFFQNDIDLSSHQGDLLAILELQEKTMPECIEYALGIMVKSKLSTSLKKRLSVLAKSSITKTNNLTLSITWLKILFIVDAKSGVLVLKAWLAQIPKNTDREEVAVNFFAELRDEPRSRIKAVSSNFERLEILEYLVPLSYQYLRLDNDLHRSGTYRPVPRDDAQRVRSHLITLVSNTVGIRSYQLLTTWADNKLFKDHRDYFLNLAKSRAEADSELDVWKEKEISQFAEEAEKPPQNEKNLYDIAVNRLLELKDSWENGDTSIARSIQRIDQEEELRVLIADQLGLMAKGKYHVAQEEEMADKKRTDIRFHFVGITPVPCELKIADNWSFNKLHERLENQLIKQYMKKSPYGIFLLLYSELKNKDGKKKKRSWKDSQQKNYSFSEVIQDLELHAKTLVEQYINVKDLNVIGIDLTARHSLSLKKPSKEVFFSMPSAFGDDFLSEQDNRIPQEREAF